MTPPDPPSLALVLPYFGPLPSYFDLWLHTAGLNADVAFLLFADQPPPPDRVPANVRVFPTTLAAVRDRLSAAVGFEVCLPRPYKLCDFKPAYGLAFAPELAGFDFWGHCDPDILWGRLRHFLTPDLFAAYDKLLIRGHLSLYRNAEGPNRFFTLPPPAGVADYRAVFTDPVNTYFDEWTGMAPILARHGIAYYDDLPVANIDSSRRDLRVLHRPNHRPQAFTWEGGRLLRHFVEGGEVRADEFAYIHLQKRRMNAPPAGPVPGRIGIGPDRFDFDPGPLRTVAALRRLNPPAPLRDWATRAAGPWRRWRRLRREARHRRG